MEFYHEGYYLYQIADINLATRKIGDFSKVKNKYDLVDEECVNYNTQQIINTKSLNNVNFKCNFNLAKKGDILISLKQNFKPKEFNAVILNKDYVVTDKFAIITPKEKVNGKKLVKCFKDDYIISQIKPMDIGKDHFNINIKELSNILIPIKKISW